MRKIPIIVIAGPTASGKTALAIEIAKKINGEVVCADSMQIYKGMDIATAKPTKEEMQGIPHHLVDFLDPGEAFSVADYVELAHNSVTDIYSRGKTAIVCGGTGLYINSLIDNIQFQETCSKTDIRNELKALAQEKGNAYLLDMLRSFDPETAQRLHENNLSRIIRAIEIYKTTGVTMSEQIKNSKLIESPYSACVIGLDYKDRQALYDRIDLRVDIMLNQGLLDEAERVISDGSLKTARQAIGYKELSPFFSGDASLDECIANLKQSTRRYAKRQLTWFRKREDIHWIYPDETGSFSELTEKALRIIYDFMRGGSYEIPQDT